MLGAERALRDGLELGPHALALPPIARGGGAQRRPSAPLSLSCPTCKEVRQSGAPESLPWPLIPSSGHCSPWCSVQDRCCNGARLTTPSRPLSPGQPHLAPVGVAFLQQRLRFTDKISRGFLSSLRPPFLCWGPVFRPLPAGASRRTKQGDQCSAVSAL